MKLIFLGSGSAFTVGDNNYHSNMLLENESGQRLLIDCGSDARFSLYEMGLSFPDIRDVYISHLHADHVGGLEWLAFTTMFNFNEKPNLYISEQLTDSIWENVLSGGLKSLQEETANLSSYFEVHPIKEGGHFLWHNLKLQLIRTIHVESEFILVPSYGLLFTVNGLNIFITTDTQAATSQLKEVYDIADIIFHDCETSELKSGVHAHYDELVKLPNEIKNKMWLYHYNPGPLPDAVKDGFRGFVKKGQCFDFSDMSTL